MTKNDNDLFKKWKQWNIKDINKLWSVVSDYISKDSQDHYDLFEETLNNQLIMENIWRVKTFKDYAIVFLDWEDDEFLKDTFGSELKQKLTYECLFENWWYDREQFEGWDDSEGSIDKQWFKDKKEKVDSFINGIEEKILELIESQEKMKRWKNGEFNENERALFKLMDQERKMKKPLSVSKKENEIEEVKQKLMSKKTSGSSQNQGGQ